MLFALCDKDKISLLSSDSNVMAVFFAYTCMPSQAETRSCATSAAGISKVSQPLAPRVSRGWKRDL
jgi:hypothetical protein